MPQPLKILLVDDEPRVLDGLKRMLRARRDWQVVAANGGEEALRVLAQEPIDVVVSDMRMPGMGGDELLDRVRREHSAAIRIILSGQAEHEHLVSALGPVHQFLSKPCGLDQLADAIERGVGLRHRLAGAGDGDAAADGETPGEPPERFRTLLGLSRTGDLVPERMAELLGTDAALAGRLVAAAAAFSVPSRPAPAALVDALVAIGPAGTLALTLLGSLLAPDGRHDALWRHALEVGALAKAIAMAEQSSANHIAWAVQAGVLHDLGLVVPGGAGGGHALLGARTLSRWGLPGPIVEAVAFHHDPLAARLPATAPLTAVHVADAWCAERAPDPDHPAPGLDAGYLERHGLAERLARWAALAAQLPLREQP